MPNKQDFARSRRCLSKMRSIPRNQLEITTVGGDAAADLGLTAPQLHLHAEVRHTKLQLYR